MRTNHLAMKQLLFTIAEYGCVHEDRESLASIVDWVFEQSLVNDSSTNTAYISEEAYEDRLAALW